MRKTLTEMVKTHQEIIKPQKKMNKTLTEMAKTHQEIIKP